MIVSYPQVKDSLFGKFLSCLLYGVGPKLMDPDLDFERLSPTCSLNGHEVDFRVVFGKFEQVLRDEPWTPTSPAPTPQPTTPLPTATLESLRSLSRDIGDVQSNIERAEEDWPSADYVSESVADGIASAVRDLVYDCISHTDAFDDARSEAESCQHRIDTMISALEVEEAEE